MIANKKIGGKFILIKTGLADFRASTVKQPQAIWASAILTVVVFLILFSASVFGKSITVDIDGEKSSFFVFSKTVEDALHDSSITLSSEDEISSELTDELYNGQVLYINKAFPLTLTVNGDSRVLYSTEKTVSEFLSDNGIELSEYDILSVDKNTQASQNMNIVLSKADITYETVSEAIPFETRSVPNYSEQVGKTTLKSEGSEGLKETCYMVVMRNGELVSKQTVEEKIIKEPVDRVTEYGTIVPASVSRSGNVRAKNVITMTATAYDLSYESCGKSPGQKGYGITASGMKAQRGVVAVDPRVIPLGTKLYIESADGRYVYGNAVAADTGGAIKGNKIDLFMDTRAECLQFGRRTVNVYILE